MPRIQPLPPLVVDRIAAGEVIDSLTAAVRELIDNALDAEATRISLSLWPDTWRIQVADNGMGMGLTDLQQAAIPHTTSKIHDAEDLQHIHTLGFRGEALHSLAQLSRLELCSRQSDSPDGWRLTYTHTGEPAQIEAIAIAPGTIVTVEDLFGTWPERRQGLPSTAQQLRAIQLLIQTTALCHPHVVWQIKERDRDWFTLWPGSSPRDILPQLLKGLDPAALREWRETDGNSLSSYLLLGLPDRLHRHRPDWVKVAVNGRLVRSPELEQVILSAFRRTLPRDRYPVCFVHLRVPPPAVDWNRHPAKAELYLHPLEEWQTWIREAIAQTLHLNGIGGEQERTRQLIKTAESGQRYLSRDPSRDRLLDFPPGDSLGGDQDLGAVLSDALPLGDRLPNPQLGPSSTTGQAIGGLRAVAQIHQTYIVAEHASGLWLVEQHIAHERVLYEELCDRWQLVPIEPPVLLKHLSTRQVEQLERLGLDITLFGEDCWAVRSVPGILAQRDDLSEALGELSQGGDLQAAQVATACRSAIRNGTPLSLGEMQRLLDQWQGTRHPHTCPHGRPIYLSLEESALARFFRRHWVIGKSHGL